MRVEACSEIGGRTLQLDRAFSIVEEDSAFIFVLDGIGDSDDSFVDEFARNIRSGVDLSIMSGSGSLSGWMWELISEAASKCKNKGKVCSVFSLITKNKIVIGHCGDCRAYLIDRDIVTIDHSLASERAGSNQEHWYVANHPLRNRVTKTISKSEQYLEVREYPKLKNGERIVLCSDGWWRNLDVEIISSVNHGSLNNLVLQAAKKPIIEPDNVTAVLLTDSSSIEC